MDDSKAGKRDDVNLSGLKFGESDKNGIAEFRFMPKDLLATSPF